MPLLHTFQPSLIKLNVFQTKFSVCGRMHNMCSTHFILLGLITQTSPDDRYKLWISPLGNFLHPLLALSLSVSLRSKYSQYHPFLKHSQCVFFTSGKLPSFMSDLFSHIKYNINLEHCIWLQTPVSWSQNPDTWTTLLKKQERLICIPPTPVGKIVLSQQVIEASHLHLVLRTCHDFISLCLWPLKFPSVISLFKAYCSFGLWTPKEPFCIGLFKPLFIHWSATLLILYIYLTPLLLYCLLPSQSGLFQPSGWRQYVLPKCLQCPVRLQWHNLEDTNQNFHHCAILKCIQKFIYF
jgi:hypothetical protein